MTVVAQDKFTVVSSDSDQLILVNERDEEIGSADKLSCHDGQGLLHRAFSILLFNQHGEVLLQKRAPGKRLWGGYWSNTCCSHPRHGETMHEAAQRRLEEELGVGAELCFLYKFEYQAQFDQSGAEHELCSVFIGHSKSAPEPNVHEISEIRWVSADQLEAELNASPEDFTPWFKLEWAEINTKFRTQLQHVIQCAA